MLPSHIDYIIDDALSIGDIFLIFHKVFPYMKTTKSRMAKEMVNK
jgi:hypothetical protein